MLHKGILFFYVKYFLSSFIYPHKMRILAENL